MISDKDCFHVQARLCFINTKTFAEGFLPHAQTQIENEGNDPVESGESYGTPHDLANLYSTKRDKTIS